MIRTLYRAPNGELHTDITIEKLAAVLQEPKGFLWVDFKDESLQTCESILQEIFHFHALAIDNALKQSHVPKIDDWDTYLYLVLHAVGCNEQKCKGLKTLELDIFLGKSYVVTYQMAAMPPVDRIWDIYQRDEHHMEKGAWYLLYQLTDELVADYMPIIEEIDEALEQIENQIFNNPKPDLLENIFTLKRSLLNLRRIIAPQREVLNKLARVDYNVLSSEHRIFFRDVYDHLVQMYDITENLRDLVSGALDTYLSVVNNRMNEIMKTLAVITTIFMPISFLVGFFGMNFFKPIFPLDTWTSKSAFSAVLAVIVGTPLGMYLWMRKRAWM